MLDDSGEVRLVDGMKGGLYDPSKADGGCFPEERLQSYLAVG